MIEIDSLLNDIINEKQNIINSKINEINDNISPVLTSIKRLAAPFDLKVEIDLSSSSLIKYCKFVSKDK